MTFVKTWLTLFLPLGLGVAALILLSAPFHTNFFVVSFIFTLVYMTALVGAHLSLGRDMSQSLTYATQGAVLGVIVGVGSVLASTSLFKINENLVGGLFAFGLCLAVILPYSTILEAVAGVATTMIGLLGVYMTITLTSPFLPEGSYLNAGLRAALYSPLLFLPFQSGLLVTHSQRT